jgi:glycosyltransferase involved in cell wall biosynthesis
MTTKWHILTREFPPQPGGISDYTGFLAEGLAAAGDRVHVWCPPAPGPDTVREGVVVHRLPAGWTPAVLRRLSRELRAFPGPRRLLVQWTPHSYGYRSLNLFLCLWLWWRAARHRDRVEVMVHEFGLAFRQGSWRQDVAAAVHRVMAIAWLRAAGAIWVSIPSLEALARPYLLGRRVSVGWLPVFSTVPEVSDPGAVADLRARFAPAGGYLVGHFGSFTPIVAGQLAAVLPALLRRQPRAAALLIGRGGDRFRERLLGEHPDLAGRLYAAAGLPPAAVAPHLQACDLLVQPFEEGISSRRTSVMSALASGCPIVSTRGRWTEPVWEAAAAVALAPAGDPAALVDAIERLLADPAERQRLGRAGLALYRDRFDRQVVVSALRSA